MAGRPDRIPLGRIGRPFGIQGEVRVRPYNSRSQNFLHVKVLYLRGERGEEAIEVIRARPHQGEFLLTLKGLRDRNDVERLRGQEVLARQEDLAPLSAGEYYWHELIGLEVWCEGKRLGEVTRLEETAPAAGGADLLVVATGAREVMIPLARAMIKTVDPAGGRIELNSFEGIWDDPV